MADFTDARVRNQDVAEATNVIIAIESAYRQMKAAVQLMDRYTAGMKPAFNTAINGIYDAEQRPELGVVRNKLATWVTNLETNHASLIGLVNNGG